MMYAFSRHSNDGTPIAVTALTIVGVILSTIVGTAHADESAVVGSEFIYKTAPFPECHASTIVESSDGTLVSAWFGGTREKNPDVGIWVSRRIDGEWTRPVEVANGVQSPELRYPTWNPVLFQPQQGPLMLFFKVGPSPREWWGEWMISEDSGATWKNRQRLPNGGIGPVKNKPVQLPDGSIWCLSSTEHDGWRLHIEVTRDLGKTWETIGPLNDKSQGAIQPSLLTYNYGRMQLVCRNQDGKADVWQTWSSDGGKTWSKLESTGLPNPNAGTDAVTLRDGRQLLVYNHTNRGTGSFPQSREMLNVAISSDGRNWSAALVLERDKGEYSYPAVIQTADGLVHIAYTWRRQRVRHVVVDPSRLKLHAITDGAWPENVERAPEAVAAAGAKKDRLNVLFIASDDLRNDLGCYGHPLVQTPNLDRLAARGITFNRAYCQQALCNPSRSSLLTGRRPDTLGIWDLPTHFREVMPDVVTLPQLFKQHGYFTQNVGKVFHNWRTEIQGDPDSWSVPAVMHFATHGSDRPQVPGDQLPPNIAVTAKTECRDVPDEAYFDGRIANLAVNALKRIKRRGNPFFLAVGFWKPHLPFNPPKKYWDLYDRDSISPADNPNRPENVPELALHNGRELLGSGNKGGKLSKENAVELRHGYLAGISYLDAQVGKVVDELERQGLADSTVIVFWSDHGFHLGEHSLWCKTSNFELDARVPLIIVPPEAEQASQTTDALVELLDLYPTLTELCGLPAPDGLEGISLVPVLRNPATHVKPAAFTQHPRPAYYNGTPEAMGVSVRTPRYRYTEWRDFETGAVVASELYDHLRDPEENRNIVDSPPDESTIEQARELLETKFPRKQPEPHRLEYHSPGTITDLGVGLWAWPMPIDWDEDGDLDLVVTCPDVPFAGTYFFENPGGDKKMPIFKPPVQVGPKFKNATLSYVDGEPRVLIPGEEFIDFRKNDFSRTAEIYPRANINPNKVRANQWRYVDYDDDGALDIIVGVGDWTEYGWDNAYDSSGQWRRGPLRGYVYLMRNEGTTDKPKYATPPKLKAAGEPIDVYGMPSPNLADFDGDGDLDLLCGEFVDSFSYFENVGTRSKPKFEAAKNLVHDGEVIRMDLQMIVPTAIDWDDDGDMDLICGDEDGRVAFIEHTGRVSDGLPEFLPPRYFQQEAQFVKFGALVTPVSVDWDDDGDEDLICGNTAGYIGFIENLDGGLPPKWAPPRRLHAGGETLRIQAGPNGSIQGPCEAKWGYTTLSVADWDHDDRLDLVVNSIWGKVVWYRNVGTRSDPKLAAAQAVEVDWPVGSPPPKPAWNWWDPGPRELSTQWRTTPVVVDLNRDGLNDLVMLDHEGYLSFFERTQQGDELGLNPGRRVFENQQGEPLKLSNGVAGKSGRRKLCFADWDGDGRLDLLVNSRSIDWYRNVSNDDATWVLEEKGPLDERHLAGHTTSPTIVDWDRNGQPDLLIGAEDGHLYYLPNDNQPVGKRAAVNQNTRALSGTRRTTTDKQPNIVFVLVDDLGWKDVGYNGSRLCKTPNIDRLASQGMRFNQAYAPAPICSASRAAFLTGRSPARLNFEFVTKYVDSKQNLAGLPLHPPPYTLNLPHSEETMAECLRSAGYHTAFFGKWHLNAHHQRYLGWSPSYGPAQQGFDVAVEDFGGHTFADPKGEKQAAPTSFEAGEYPPDSMTDRAVEFIDSYDGDDSFFLYVSHFYVHTPVRTQAQWLTDKYAARLRPGETEKHAEFAAFVEILDHHVGRLLNSIDRAGIAENTVVVLTSDNGGDPLYAEHAPLRGHKWTLYEGGIRVPMVVRWPGEVTAGSQCDVPVIGMDLLPTFCDIAGVQLPEVPLDGVSLVSLLRGDDSAAIRDRTLVWHFPYYHPEKRTPNMQRTVGINDDVVPFVEPHSAIRKGAFKLIYFYESGREEFYDLRSDLSEQHDLAESQAEKTSILSRALIASLRGASARFPTKVIVAE